MVFLFAIRDHIHKLLGLCETEAACHLHGRSLNWIRFPSSLAYFSASIFVKPSFCALRHQAGELWSVPSSASNCLHGTGQVPMCQMGIIIPDLTGVLGELIHSCPLCREQG